MTSADTNLALVLGGGGARAAYQAGFLSRLARAMPNLHFAILTGVSAGSINSAFLANTIGNFTSGVEQLASLWRQMSVDQIFRSDFGALSGAALRWGAKLVGGGAHLTPPTRGLVNTSPLREFLTRVMDARDGKLDGVAENIRRGRLKAIGLTTTDYGTSQSITWVQGYGVTMWQRPMRRSVMTELSIEHVMGSCALPAFFPAIQLGDSWHGDGGIRLTAPLSPALHLGADRILAVSTRYQKNQEEADRPSARGYPSPASIIGVLLNAVFLDMLDLDAMLMQRINKLLASQPEGIREGLRTVELLVLRPSRDLETLAVDFEAALPRSFRYLVRGLGTRDMESSALLATILFEREYIHRVLEIGERDAETQLDTVRAFLAGETKRS